MWNIVFVRKLGIIELVAKQGRLRKPLKEAELVAKQDYLGVPVN